MQNHTEQTEKLEQTSFYHFFELSEKYIKTAREVYKNQYYKDYIKHYLHWYQNHIFCGACQGNSKLSIDFNLKDFFIYQAPTKLNRAFKELNYIGFKDTLNDFMKRYLEGWKDKLIQINHLIYTHEPWRLIRQQQVQKIPREQRQKPKPLHEIP